MDSKRFVWADTLRGLACIIVMFSHILSTDPVYGKYANGCGKVGVWLFMLLSGFLLGRSSFYRKQTLSIEGVLRFYEKKALKILPEYLLVLLMSVALNLFDVHTAGQILLFQASWGHFWYMPVIMKFYLAAPALVVVRRVLLIRGGTDGLTDGKSAAVNRGFFRYVCLLMAVTVLIAILFPYTAYPENSTALKWYLPVFIIGIALSESLEVVRGSAAWLDILPPTAIAIILMLTPLGRQLLFGIEPENYLQNKYLLVGLLWMLVMLGALYGKRTESLLEKARLLQKTAVYSYGLYLYHYVILQWLCIHYRTVHNSLRGLLTLTVATAFAVLTKKAKDLADQRINEHVRCAIVFFTVVALLIAGYP